MSTARPHGGEGGGARRAGWRFLLAHPAHFLALGAGSGLVPRAPGTAGTLWAWAAFALLEQALPAAAWPALLLLAACLGWWACTRTARALGVADPSAIVWDEVLAFWIVLWVLAPADWPWQLAAFVVFRFFDVAKPGPVRWADRRFKPSVRAAGGGIGWAQGAGILLDDLVAAACTLCVVGPVFFLVGR